MADTYTARTTFIKQSKLRMDYEHGTTDACCKLCKHYSYHACARVTGVINPDMHCMAFMDKKAKIRV